MKTKKILSMTLVFALLVGIFTGCFPILTSAAADEGRIGDLISASDIPLHLYYDEEASHGIDTKFETLDQNSSESKYLTENVDDDWERWSIPLGNGYFGANVFGRTDSERIQLTEKTLANPYRINNNSSLPTDGLNNFSETYIDFGHKSSTSKKITNYSRELDLYTAISTVSYKYDGVTYSREYFTSYVDNAMIIKLTASESGKLGFTLRPTIPYEQEYMAVQGDNGGKSGTVVSSVTDGVGSIVLSGKLEYFDIDFVGLYTVYTNGGTITSANGTNAAGETDDGTITVSGANDAYIIINLGTDYELTSATFASSRTDKPTFKTDLAVAMAKVEKMRADTLAQMDGMDIESGYQTLKSRHVTDYSNLFGRVSLDLGCTVSDADLTTDVLLSNYKNGNGNGRYLETLYFQYGRYLLIASSRENTLPANLQGTWNRYNHAPWSAGYWHNINVQMNYWPAFSTNLSETFEAYVNYNNAYMEASKNKTNSIINSYNKDVYGQDGGNGWSVDTGGYVNDINASWSIGNLGMTTQLFWEYYLYSQDETLLRETVYPVIIEAARFITKMVKKDANGNYIAIYTDSPEQYVNGQWYHTDKGSTYAQTFAYLNNYNLLEAVKELGIIDLTTLSEDDRSLLNTVMEQLDKYNPIVVGLSGQVKEFYEEEYYGDLGEWEHRHISQLVGLYPGNLITEETAAWFDAAEVSLANRGDKSTGWGVAHRLNLWARLKDGDHAYTMLHQLLSVNTATNLWDLHPPFQIDGNFGGTAGISEMLLQSHAGYIEPLAAIPSDWQSGSYTGLVARGNFEVAAKWADGVLTDLNITSKNGGTATVKYSGITGATLVDSKGNKVAYTVAGENMISFATTEGETYRLAGFTAAAAKPAAVTGLTANTVTLSDTTLTWTASADAVSYNVYVARDNDKSYTFLAKVKGTKFVYSPTELENDRLTFAVTAVNAAGTESKRALAYSNPADIGAAIEKFSANIFDGSLQVAIKANEYTAKYRLYYKATAKESWQLVEESSYPIIIDNNYNKNYFYAVSAVSYFGDETEIQRISSFGSDFSAVDYQPTNIFLGSSFVPTAEANKLIHSSSHGYDKLTDGSLNATNSRFSTKTDDSVFFDATITLPNAYVLGELQLFGYSLWSSTCNNLGQYIKVEACYNGVWTTVAEISSVEDMLKLFESNSAETDCRYIGIDLSGVRAQEIRIRIENPVSGNSISLSEIRCTGLAIENSDYIQNIFRDDGTVYQFVAGDATADSNTWKPYTYDKITDGKTESANAFKSGNKHTAYGSMSFDGKVYKLGNLTVNYEDYKNRCGNGITVKAWRNGEVVKTVTLTYDSVVISRCVPLDGVEADKITFEVSGRFTDGDCISITEMTCSGIAVEVNEDTGVYMDNLFAGNEFIPTQAASGCVWSPHTYDKLTDGKTGDSNRFATSGASSFVDATLFFGEKKMAKLDTLTVDYRPDSLPARVGNGIRIDVLGTNGKWSTVLNETYTEGFMGQKTFKLGGVEALAVRLYVSGLLASDSGCIEIHEVSCSGTLMDFDKEFVDNIFASYDFVEGESAGTIWKGDYSSLTDGDASSSGRLVTSGNAIIDGVMDFGGMVYELGTLTITYESAARCGKDIKISVYRNGKWSDVVNKTYDTTVTSRTFDLGGVEAEKVKIYVSGKQSDGDCTSILEVTCNGLAIARDENYSDNIFTDFEFVKGENAGTIWQGSYSSLTDGDATNGGRLATNNGTNDTHIVDGVMDFEGKIYKLNTLIITYSDTNNCGKDIKISVYRNGQWTDYYHEHTTAVKTYTFELGGAEAEKVKIYVSGKQFGNYVGINEITCSGSLYTPNIAPGAEDPSSNILAGKTSEDITITGADAHPSFADPSKMFDGIANTDSNRFAVYDNANSTWTIEIDLGDAAMLYTLKFVPFASQGRSDKTCVELYRDGTWVTVLKDFAINNSESTSVSLYGIMAQKIRITFKNSTANQCASMREISLTTTSGAKAIDRSELLNKYKELDAMQSTQVGFNEIKDMNLKTAYGYLMNFEADQATINDYVNKIGAMIENMSFSGVDGSMAPDLGNGNIAEGIPSDEKDFSDVNLNLKDNIDINFYGDISETTAEQYPDAFVVVKYDDGRSENVKLSDMDRHDGRLVLSITVAAAEMSDTIEIRTVLDSSTYGDSKSISVKEYAQTILDGNYSAETKKLMSAMLTYGSYAQDYFGYNTENSATDNRDEIDSIISANVTDKISVGGSASGMSLSSWLLSLDSEVSAKIVFSVSGYDIGAYSAKVTLPDGTVKELEFEQVGTRYRVVIDGIVAANLAKGYTLVITNDATQDSLTVQFSAMAYVGMVLRNSGDMPAELVQLAKSLKLYSDAATAYANAENNA